MEKVFDKLKKNNVISIGQNREFNNDYKFSNSKDMINQLEEQIDMEDRIVMHNLNGHAIIIKIRD